MKLEFGTHAWGCFEHGVKSVTVVSDYNEHMVEVQLDENPDLKVKLCRSRIHPTRQLALRDFVLRLDSFITDARMQIKHIQNTIEAMEKDIAKAKEAMQRVYPDEVETGR